MKTLRILTAVMFLAVMAAGMSSCGKSGDSAAANDTIPPVSVRVEPLRPAKMVDAFEVAGTIKAYEDVNVSPEEGGIVKEWKVEKGAAVRKGDVIAILKDDVIKAGYDAAVAQYNLAKLNAEKQKKVYDEQGISELQYKSMTYNRDAAKANMDLMKARWEHTRIKSPIDGIVDNTIPNAGEMAPPGMPLAHIVNTGRIKILAEVPERNAGLVRIGTPVLATVDAFPADTLRGSISFVGSTVSPVNRTLAIEVAIPNPLRKIKSEMVAKVRIILETRSNALLVSEEVVQHVDRDRFIVYVENDGKAEERRVTLGGRQGNQVEIARGLKSGDRLIVVGFQKLVNGQPVVVAQ